ncbi:hypothetical protein ACIP2X_14525 [Streptomyces sp. NPDC089424]|uniref:hypothetical protein n=1 Tax=Streptomyces sp. NPDC089424 TaxID=3365917 RepID=UPI00382E5B0C
MFEHRTEAEMRLYSARMARELAQRKRQQEHGDGSDPAQESEAAHVDFPEDGDSAENDEVLGGDSVAGETRGQ